jgi:hypothetical protein
MPFSTLQEAALFGVLPQMTGWVIGRKEVKHILSILPKYSVSE